MIRKLNESKKNKIYVARLDDGEVFYEGKLNSVFKDILGRTIDTYYTVEDAVVSYLRMHGYGDVDDWSSDELADVFVDEFIKDKAEDFNMYKDFTLIRNTVGESIKRKSNRSVNEKHEFRHYLSNNPTDYERYVNFAETLVTVCENLTEAAERCLRRIEDNEEFYTDPKNERWYGFNEKMDQISKVMRQIESLTNKIDNKM